MSAEASSFVWRYSPYTGTKFAIHLAIGDVVNDTNDNLFWMATRTLAQKTRSNRRTVQRVIDEMVADGYLEAVKAATQHRPAVYRFIHKTGPMVWGDEPRGDISSLRGDISSPRGGHRPPELNITKHEPKPSSSSDDDGFNKFWAEYPRKVGKGTARRAWKTAIKKTDLDTILEATLTYRLSCSKETQYIAHPATWLNGERWADNQESLHTTNKPDLPVWVPCGTCQNGWIETNDNRLAPCPCTKGQP